MTASAGRLRTAILTGLALVAFAGNSVLCRLALGDAAIDAASFATVRLVSGALILSMIAAASRKKAAARHGGSWISAAMLFLYAVAFSFAYISLSTATGALILFGAVQATMILTALGFGERPHPAEWMGLVLALAGLVYLVLPGLSAPSPAGSALMALAGIAWGVYSLRGRSAADAAAATTDNFVRSLPLVLAVSVIMLRDVHISPRGALLAVSSGAVASGLGYVAWYAALQGLTATRAAMVQLAVPVLAALGGIVLLAEEVSLRLLLSAILILGGIALSAAGRPTPAP